MTPSSVASASIIFFCLLLLPTQHGASSHARSYKLGNFFFKTPGKSSGNSQQASTVPTATTCSSSITTVLAGNNKLPVLHRQSPCSPLHSRLPSLKPADVLRRDTSRLRCRLFSSKSSVVAGPASSPAASIVIPINNGSTSSDPSSVNFHVNGSSDSSLPGSLDYSVLVGYGMPVQQFLVSLDTTGGGGSHIWCKPCASSGSDDYSPAFDTSRSSTFTQLPCGSPDCPATNCSGGGSVVCPFVDPYLGTILGTFSKDVLTLPPSTVVDDFTFVCLDGDHPLDDLPEAAVAGETIHDFLEGNPQITS